MLNVREGEVDLLSEEDLPEPVERAVIGELAHQEVSQETGRGGRGIRLRSGSVASRLVVCALPAPAGALLGVWAEPVLQFGVEPFPQQTVLTGQSPDQVGERLDVVRTCSVGQRGGLQGLQRKTKT